MMLLTAIGALCFSLTSGSPLTSRIINGTFAPRVPWMADIITYYDPSNSFTRYCGGSLIARNWVLTAKHCIYSPQNQLTSINGDFHVTVGSNSIMASQFIKVIDIVQYNSKHEDDVILLKLERDVKRITPIKVQYEDDLHYEGRTATIYGWGTTETGAQSIYLKQTNVELMSREECANSRMICFDPQTTHSNSCAGDSGGPMIIDENGEKRLIGVAHSVLTWSNTESPCDGPKSMYASTAYYGSWIQSVIV